MSEKNLDDIYSSPFWLGGPEKGYPDPAIWSADWRKRLPEGHPKRPADGQFIEHDDPHYMAILKLLEELGDDFAYRPNLSP